MIQIIWKQLSPGMVIVCMIVLQLNESLHNVHKYYHELDNRVDQLIMMPVAMQTMFHSNDLKTWEDLLWWPKCPSTGGRSRCSIASYPHCNLRQPAKPVWNREEIYLDDMWILFTCSPLLLIKLEQQCQILGVARSVSEPRYLPSESYLE